MKNFKTKDKSLYTMLVKSYIGFSLVLFVLLLLVYFFMAYAESKIMQSPNATMLHGGQKLLLAGEYEKLNMKKLLGTVGYFEVLDENRELIYTNYDLQTESYTKREIDCIQEYDSPEEYEVTSYVTEEGEKQILVTKRIHEWDTGYQADEAYFLLDESLTVTGGSLSNVGERFSQRELNYLTTRENADYNIGKYTYTGDDGKEYILIMHIRKMDRQRYKKMTTIRNVFIPICVGIYLVVTAVFTMVMHRKVKEPLEMLNEGILDFAQGSRDTEIAYKGPREFAVIFDSFNVMAKKLKESEEAKELLLIEKQRMLADISHDLKTPITVIQGYAKAVADGLVDERTQNKYLQTISQKTENLTEMINIFYDYSKLEHPEFQLVKNKQDMAEFVRGYLASKYDEIELHGFELEVEIPEDVVEYSFDEVQFKRVFDNIISNSLKHNKPGTVIYVTVQQSERSIRIEIGDNGSGIPEEIKAGLFDPFVVGDDSRHSRQGSGLGLAVARKITELHGGALFLEEAESPVISTLFVIRLLK